MGSNESSSKSSAMTPDQRDEMFRQAITTTLVDSGANAGNEDGSLYDILNSDGRDGSVFSDVQLGDYTSAWDNYQDAPEYQGTTADSLGLSEFNTDAMSEVGSISQDGAARLNDGDYSALQQSIIDARMGALNTAKADALQDSDQAMADRGIYSSGAAISARNDINTDFANQQDAIYNEAIQAAINAEQTDNQDVNSYNSSIYGTDASFALGKGNIANDQNSYVLGRGQLLADENDRSNQYALATTQDANNYAANEAAAQNAYNLDSYSNLMSGAESEYNANWQPLNYLQSLWSDGNGTVTVNGSSGWNI